MASGDGHVGGGGPDPRETATGAGADPTAAILAPQAAARMAAAARALIGVVTKGQQPRGRAMRFLLLSVSVRGT
jgi:hypothetical protein